MKFDTISTLRSELYRGRPLLTHPLESTQNTDERFLDFRILKGKFSESYPKVISPHATSGEKREVSSKAEFKLRKRKQDPWLQNMETQLTLPLQLLILQLRFPSDLRVNGAL